MIQEVFGGRLIDLPGVRSAPSTKPEGAARHLGRGVAALLSLSTSPDGSPGRRCRTTSGASDLFHLLPLGALLYASRTVRGPEREGGALRRPLLPHPHHVRGRLRDIPAYLADILSALSFVGGHPRPAAHGLVGRGHFGTRTGELHPGIPDRPRIPARRPNNFTMYVLAALLCRGFLRNLALRPVDERHYMTEETLPGSAGRWRLMGRA